VVRHPVPLCPRAVQGHVAVSRLRHLRRWRHRPPRTLCQVTQSALGSVSCVQIRHFRHRPRRPHAGRHARPQRPGALTRRRQAPIIALPQANPDSRTVSLILAEATASIALFAIAAHADEREAHVREVERYGQTLPEGSHGRRNRQAIATRETRVAARLRAVERAYRIAIERNVTSSAPELTRSHRSSQHSASREIELE
jgi:hypothetical protein